MEDMKNAEAPQAGDTRTEKTKLSSGAALIKALERRASERKGSLLNPRADRVWIKREKGRVTMTTASGEEWPVTDGALTDLSGILGVPNALLERLSRLPKNEDCRLLNVLLWEKGEESSWKIRVVVDKNRVTTVTLGEYRSLSPERLARTLERLEAAGEAEVARWDLTPLGWWIIVRFMKHEPLDLSHGDNPDLWDKTALLFNHEDGRTAAAIVPGLMRRWGKYWLPIAQGTIRRHDGVGDALVDSVKALQVAEGAPFAKAARMLRAAQAEKVTSADKWLQRLTSPWTETQRTATKAEAGSWKGNSYRMLTSAMRVGYHLEEPVKRLASLRILGNLLMDTKEST